MDIIEKKRLPFGPGLLQSILDWQERIRTDHPTALLISGESGTGKTTLAVHCAEFFQQAPINPEEQIGIGFDDFIRKFEQAQKKGYKVVIYDEGGDASKYRFMSTKNQNARTFLDQYRITNIFIIHIIQLFDEIDPSLSKRSAYRALLYIPKRGTYVAFAKPGITKLRKNFKKHRDDDPPSWYKGAPFAFIENVDDLDPEKKKSIKKYSDKGKQDVRGSIGSALYTPAQMGKELNLSSQTIRNHLKQNKIQHSIKKGTRCYYTVKDFEKVREVLKK